MSLQFRSLSSSSAGNCLVLWTDTTRVIVDCGLGSMRRTRELLVKNLQDPRRVDAVLISHMHGDHVNQHSLRVLESFGLEVRVHEQCLAQLRDRHFQGRAFPALGLKTFSDEAFTIGDLSVQPFAVPHHPRYPNYGFAVRYREGRSWKQAVLVTDFHNGSSALGHFVDADFIFVESNHDPGLLALHANPNSRFHMSNPKTAGLLCRAHRESKKKPHTVMLGHLSAERNTERFALEEVRGAFRAADREMDFLLSAAPHYESSETVIV